MGARMKNEFEAKEKAAQEELDRYTKRFVVVDTQIKGIDECLEEKIETAENLLFFLGKIWAMGFADINEMIRKNRYKEMFLTPRPADIIGVQSPGIIWSYISAQMLNKKRELVNEREVLTKLVLELEEKAHRRKVDRLTVDYGKASVDLTNINIKVAIWVPVIILVFTLLATIAFEAFKPEILNWIRRLVGLAALPK
jgi:hypothetical protein